MKNEFEHIPISYLIYQAERAIHHNINQSLQAQGIPIMVEQWAIMRELFTKNELTQQELAHKTRKDKTTLVRLVDTLEKNGWVERKPDPKDRRKKLISYTSKASKLKDQVIGILRNNNQKLLNNIDPEKVSEMQEVLLLMFRNLEWEFDFMDTNCRIIINEERKP